MGKRRGNHMEHQPLKDKILNVLGESRVGTLATVVNDKPHSRYMTFYHQDLTLYTPTSIHTHKVEEIEKNPNVHILIGYDGEGYGDAYLEIEGTAHITDSDELKEKLWNEHMKRWFKGADDPDYIVLTITPSSIRLMNGDEGSEQRLTL
jgi:general stress protein 26